MRADDERSQEVDPSGGATHFQMTIGPSTEPFKGQHPYLKSFGPFNNSYPNKQVPAKTNIYIDFYK